MSYRLLTRLSAQPLNELRNQQLLDLAREAEGEEKTLVLMMSHESGGFERRFVDPRVGEILTCSVDLSKRDLPPLVGDRRRS